MEVTLAALHKGEVKELMHEKIETKVRGSDRGQKLIDNYLKDCVELTRKN